MKKYTLLFVLVLSLGLLQVAFGQAPKFGVGGVLAFPTGNFGDIASSVGFGGTAQVLFPMGENMALGAQAGYITFGGEEFGGFDYTISAIPILAEGRYYLGVPGGPRPYVGALLGFHIFSTSVEGEMFGFTVDESESDTEFTIAPMGGIEVGQLDISAFYMIISDANYFGGRIGFNFGG